MHLLHRLWDRYLHPHFLGRSDQEDSQKNWCLFTAASTDTESVTIFRIRMAKPRLADIDEYSTAVTVTWRYTPPDIPPPNEVKAQHLAFEQALDPLSWTNGTSELVQVTIGGGRKQWLYYARSSQRFMRRMNALLSSHPPYPLEIEFMHAPDWEYWSATVDALRASERSRA